MGEWIRETYCNTLALILQDTAAFYAGVPGDQLSYSFDVQNSEEWKIFLYDEDAKGNGTMGVVREYFQIPPEVRDVNENFERGALPTCDFVTELERRMATCPEHIAHSIATEGIEDSELIPRDYFDEAKQLRRDYKTHSWDHVGVTSVRDAALHNVRRWFFVDDANQQFTLDYHRQALELCDSGCPACNGDGIQNAFRGPLGEQYTCRSLVERLIQYGPDMDGYMLKIRDEDELAQLAGQDLAPQIQLTFLPDEGGNGKTPILVHRPTPPICLHWIRGDSGASMTPSPDWLVRHREAI